MIIDGHAHVYEEKSATRIISSFTKLHHMEPTSSVGKRTVSNLLSRMEECHSDYTVLANFAPVKSVERTNEWTLSIARKHSQLIPLVSVYPGLPIGTVEYWFEKGAKGIKMHNVFPGHQSCPSGIRNH